MSADPPAAPPTAPRATDVAVAVDDLIATEYTMISRPAVHADPAGQLRRCEFGTFVHTPMYSERHDANQLVDARCDPARIGDLIAALNAEYRARALPFRKVSGHDPATWAHLAPALEAAGYCVNACHIMRWLEPPRRSPNPAVRVRIIPSPHPDNFHEISATIGRNRDALAFVVTAGMHLDGAYFVGELDGESVGVTGFYLVNGVGRFFPVMTAEAARNRGVATSLILAVQRHPRILAARALTILCADDGPVPLYRSLGFVPVGRFWEAWREEKPSVENS